jgi:hypothetical protein
MPNNNRQEQKARDKARELLQEVGNNLSVREAERIERKTGVDIDRITRIADRQDINVPQRVENRVDNIVQQRQGGSTSPPPPSNTNVSNTNANPGQDAYSQIYATLAEQYRTQAESYKTEAAQYKAEAQGYESKLSDYDSTFTSLKNQYSNALAQQQSANAQAASEKKRADELEKQRKDEEELEVARQVSSLRSGSTVSGSVGAGMGSLSSGGTSRSISTGARNGGILDRAYQDIDPTDSVLNRDVATGASREMRSSGGSRAQARQRALSSGTTAGQYYARRFG